jgi:hypothetical protein
LVMAIVSAEEFRPLKWPVVESDRPPKSFCSLSLCH